MAGRNPYEAVQAFLEPVQRSLSQVVTAKLTVPRDGREPHAEPHPLTLNGGQPVQLPGGRGLALVVNMHYRIVEAEGDRGPWKVQGVGYDYALRFGTDELVSYHWHPAPRNRVRSPHLHVGAPFLADGAPLSGKTHFPTRRIALEQALRLAVECGARPQASTWETVLGESQERFEHWQTWA